MDDTSRLDGQPIGFAEPVAPPLGAYVTYTLTGIADAPIQTPDAFSAATNPGPLLEQIAPAPEESRNPNTPFEAGQTEQMPESVERDPRKPIVTSSFSGKDTSTDFAPPTGVPVVPDAKAVPAKWAPPTGQPAPWGAPVAPTPTPMPRAANPGAIARVGTAPPWAMPPQGAPPGVARAPMPYQPGVMRPGTYPPGVVPLPRTVEAVEGETRARYAAAADPMAKLGVVLQSVPWYVLPILAFGAYLAVGVSVMLFIVAWVVCGSTAKVAKPQLNLCFVITLGVYLVSWFTEITNLDGGTFYETVARVGCGVLVVVLPLVVWRVLERRR